MQQLAKAYRDSGEIPQLDTPGRTLYAEYPADLEDRVLALHQRRDAGAVAIAHVLRTRDDISIANTRVHAILKEADHVTDNPNKQGRERDVSDSRRDTLARCSPRHDRLWIVQGQFFLGLQLLIGDVPFTPSY